MKRIVVIFIFAVLFVGIIYAQDVGRMSINMLSEALSYLTADVAVGKPLVVGDHGIRWRRRRAERRRFRVRSRRFFGILAFCDRGCFGRQGEYHTCSQRKTVLRTVGQRLAPDYADRDAADLYVRRLPRG